MAAASGHHATESTRKRNPSPSSACSDVANDPAEAGTARRSNPHSLRNEGERVVGEPGLLLQSGEKRPPGDAQQAPSRARRRFRPRHAKSRERV